ncbi:hypothetical protein V9L20_02470 [Variovorax sp. CCNWLW225]|uniref:hypothetical protein n=1 Tax=Variovorax sp. CCNWLW225 TaxID=3127462 RepID=UPI00307818D3
MKRAALVIVDGAGIRTETSGNAVTSSTMPFLFNLLGRLGHAVLEASGPPVGLEHGMVGNSEVGHTIIGAGFVPPSSLQRINDGYVSGGWAEHPNWKTLGQNPRIHLVGLLSEAGVHAHWRTIKQAWELATRQCPRTEVVVHLILDGVDSPAGTAVDFLRHFDEEGIDRVGLIMGRRWFCDRSGDAGITSVFVEALMGKGGIPAFTFDALRSHIAGASESTFPAHHRGAAFVCAGEPVLLLSHRADRARQSAVALAEFCPVYPVVEIGSGATDAHAFFPNAPLRVGLGFELASHGVRNTRIAESSKFPHVTRFFNGLHAMREDERSICVPAIPDAELAENPQMSLDQVLTAARNVILSEHAPHALIINIANLDQVGHLGLMEPACMAARHVDRAITELYGLCQSHGWELMITADHGNADTMIGSAGEPFNSHSDSPVPLIIVPSDGSSPAWLSTEGTLAAVAPTFLTLLGLNSPDSMHPSLIARNGESVAPAHEMPSCACAVAAA